MLEGGVGMNAGGRGVASEKDGWKELVVGREGRFEIIWDLALEINGDYWRFEI